MKVTIVGLRGIPDVMGGIESHCQNIYPIIGKENVELTVIGRKPYLTEQSYDYKGVRVIGLWSVQNKFLETFLHTFIAILYAGFVVRPDILHIHAIGPALFTPLARILGMKVVVTHHGADYNRQKWNKFAKSVLQFGERMACLFANRVIVVGRTLTNELKHKFAKHSNEILFIPNGTLTHFGQSCTTTDLPFDLNLKDKSYILAVARLVPEKGLHDLIDAFKSSQSPLKLVIVGDADHNDSYSQSIKSAASENVIIAGRRKGKALQSLYKFARVFVLPSYHEGHPIVALEAISAGTDVILSNIEPNLDLALDNDCYFEVGNIQSLAQKLSDLDSLNLSVCRSEFLARYDWQSISQSTLNVYREIMGTPKNG